MIKFNYVTPSDISYDNGNFLCLKIALTFGQIENINYIFAKACVDGDTEVVKLLLHCLNLEDTGNNYLSSAAIDNNHFKIIELVSKQPNYSNFDLIKYLISYLFIKNDEEMINVLLEHPKIDVTANGGEIISLLLNKGHLKIVKKLLEDPKIVSKLTDSQIKHYSRYNFLMQK